MVSVQLYWVYITHSLSMSLNVNAIYVPPLIFCAKSVNGVYVLEIFSQSDLFLSDICINLFISIMSGIRHDEFTVSVSHEA
jgi:hypothetical protein